MTTDTFGFDKAMYTTSHIEAQFQVRHYPTHTTAKPSLQRISDIPEHPWGFMAPPIAVLHFPEQRDGARRSFLVAAQPNVVSNVEAHAKSELSKDLYILKQLVGKDFKIKYRRSVLGVLWSVLNPLLMMIVMAAVFSAFLAGIKGDGIPNYPLYLIIGNTTFALMSDATGSALGSIVGSAALLKKVKIHRMVFPLQKVLFAIVNFGFSLIAVVAVMAWFRYMPTWHLLWLPVIIGLLAVFCTGIGLALSALNVFFRDVMHLWSVIMTAWTYATPLFWNASIIDTMGPTTQVILHANPMLAYVTAMRDIFLYQVDPSVSTMLSCLCWAIGAFIVGFMIFRKTEHKFILYI